MVLANFHTHTSHCDGRNTAREMAEAASALGFRRLGFSGHVRTPFDGGYGMAPEAFGGYIRDVLALRDERAGQMEVFLAYEDEAIFPLHEAGPAAWGAAEAAPLPPFGYSILSAHYIQPGDGGEPVCVDAWPDRLAATVRERFGGDGEALAEAYFANVVRRAAQAPKPPEGWPQERIMGHVDLVRKHNKGAGLFDEGGPRYARAASDALEAVVAAGLLVEVNTSIIARGFATEPYPNVRLLRRAKELGARLVISSDAHDTAHIGYAFADMEELLMGLGFRERWEFDGRGFEPVPLGGGGRP